MKAHRQCALHLLPGRALQLADTCSCCSELTLKQTRRLLEDDLRLPEKALDEEPHKSLIKHQVDEARRTCKLASCISDSRWATPQIMRLLVALEDETAGPVAAANRPAKRARDEATQACAAILRSSLAASGSRAQVTPHPDLLLFFCSGQTSRRSWEAALTPWRSKLC